MSNGFRFVVYDDNGLDYTHLKRLSIPQTKKNPQFFRPWVFKGFKRRTVSNLLGEEMGQTVA